jgi:hypothetical protein
LTTTSDVSILQRYIVKLRSNAYRAKSIATLDCQDTIGYGPLASAAIRTNISIRRSAAGEDGAGGCRENPFPFGPGIGCPVFLLADRIPRLPSVPLGFQSGRVHPARSRLTTVVDIVRYRINFVDGSFCGTE